MSGVADRALAAAADTLTAAIGGRVLVARAEPHPGNRVFVELLHNFTPAELDALAQQALGAVIRDVLANNHPCDACRDRVARAEAAIAALQAGGVKPTTMGALN